MEPNEYIKVGDRVRVEFWPMKGVRRMNKVNTGTEHPSGERVESLVSHEQGLAGRELDVAVAERVINQTHLCTHKQYTDDTGPFCAKGCDGFIVPHYSTDIAAAMEVVEKMRGGDGYFALYCEKGRWEAEFDDDATAFANSAAEAICRAALAAVAHNDEVRS